MGHVQATSRIDLQHTSQKHSYHWWRPCLCHQSSSMFEQLIFRNTCREPLSVPHTFGVLLRHVVILSLHCILVGVTLFFNDNCFVGVGFGHRWQERLKYLDKNFATLVASATINFWILIDGHHELCFNKNVRKMNNVQHTQSGQWKLPFDVGSQCPWSHQCHFGRDIYIVTTLDHKETLTFIIHVPIYITQISKLQDELLIKVQFQVPSKFC